MDLSDFYGCEALAIDSKFKFLGFVVFDISTLSEYEGGHLEKWKICLKISCDRLTLVSISLLRS